MKDIVFSKTDKIKIITFIAVAYGLPWLFFPWVETGENGDIFGIFMMILPTFGIVLGRIICERKIHGWLHWLYMAAFTGFTAVMGLCAAGVMSGETAYDVYLTFLVLSVFLLIGCLIDEQEFYPFKNFKTCIGICLIYTVIIWIADIPEIMDAEVSNIITVPFVELLIRPVSILITESIYLFGEEYAWRGCLQGRLQDIFGKRLGVILLGVIWELWHMPLWFTVYGANQGKYYFLFLVSARMLSTVGKAVFFGWAYMKTKNIWICVLLHGINNSMAYAFDYLSDAGVPEKISSFEGVMVSVSAIIMLLFLFSKEYNTKAIGVYTEITN